MRISPLLTLTVMMSTATGCKTRDPNRAGLLDEEDAATGGTETGLQLAEIPAAGGAWNVECSPLDAETTERYRLDIDGAVSHTDETQPLSVSVTRIVGEESFAIVTGDWGRGALSDGGPMFIGFRSGVLTAEKAPEGAYRGVFTLSYDLKAQTMDVRCTVAKAVR